MRTVRGTAFIRPTLSAVLLLLPAVAGHAIAQQEVHRQAIDTAYRNWVDATNARDMDRWATFLAPNPLFLPPDHQALRGEPAVREFYERLFADHNFSLDCRQEQIELAESEDMAWSTGTCEGTYTGPDGEVARGSTTWAKVWIRQPRGEWRCVVNSWSASGPSGEGA